MKTTKLVAGQYRVEHNNRVFRVTDLNGVWKVSAQTVKHCDHFFMISIEASKKDALRMIEDGMYEAEFYYQPK